MDRAICCRLFLCKQAEERPEAQLKIINGSLYCGSCDRYTGIHSCCVYCNTDRYYGCKTLTKYISKSFIEEKIPEIKLAMMLRNLS